MIAIGIDPGGSGAVAWIRDCNKPGFVKLSETEHDVARLARDLGEAIAQRDGDGFAVIEKVGSMPGQGVASSFKFGQSYGFCRALLIANRIPFEAVPPQSWKRAFGLIRRSKTESKTELKRRSKAKAQELFPGVKVTNANAEALLLAEFCRRTRARIGASA